MRVVSLYRGFEEGGLRWTSIFWWSKSRDWSFRMRLFEIHDHPRFPRFLRDMVTDALQVLWNSSNLYQPIIPRLRRALVNCRTRNVLDLCSGGGGPWLGLARDLEWQEYYPVTVYLTDRCPNRKAFERLQSRSELTVKFDSRSIDALRVPTDLHGFRRCSPHFITSRPRKPVNCLLAQWCIGRA